MGKVLRVGITDQEWEDLQPLLTHHGQLSFILREALKDFIKRSKQAKFDMQRRIDGDSINGGGR